MTDVAERPEQNVIAVDGAVGLTPDMLRQGPWGSKANPVPWGSFKTDPAMPGTAWLVLPTNHDPLPETNFVLHVGEQGCDRCGRSSEMRGSHETVYLRIDGFTHPRCGMMWDAVKTHPIRCSVREVLPITDVIPSGMGRRVFRHGTIFTLIDSAGFAESRPVMPPDAEIMDWGDEFGYVALLDIALINPKTGLTQ